MKAERDKRRRLGDRLGLVITDQQWKSVVEGGARIKMLEEGTAES